MPDELLEAFMRVLNDFNERYDPDKVGRVHIEMVADTQFPADKLEAMFKSAFPSPRYTTVVKGFDS